MFRTRTALILLGLIATSLSPIAATAITSNPTPDCSAGSTCTITFAYSGDYYEWTVPIGATSMTVDMAGASGGVNWAVSAGITPGRGGRVQTTLTSTPGQKLYVYVGGTGSQARTTSNVNTGGWNGGGLGGTGNGSDPSCYCGTGGGGASDIRTTAGTLSSRLVVAGGGGGSARNNGGSENSAGDAGGLVGSPSARAAYLSTTAGGGTQSAGGNGNKWDSNWAASQAGQLGLGGNSGTGTGGGGGGGGYYGGGGGSWTGGGGGSSYADASSTSATTHTAGYRTGDGYVKITYSNILGVTNLSLSLAGSVTQTEKNKAIVITASVDQAGRISFFADSKKISGCSNLTVSGSTRTCTWKPAIQKQVTLSARITPTNSGYGAANNSIKVFVVKRTGTR
jgi:hypothetical protein